jgi:hypothetical protein
MNQPNSRRQPDRTFEVDSFTEVITDAAVEHPAVVVPPSPPQCVTETCDTIQEFEESISYPDDDDTDRELRRGA